MTDSLLYLPAGFDIGIPGTGAVVLPEWNGYAYGARARAVAAGIADAGFPAIALNPRRRGLEGSQSAMPDDDLYDIRLAADYMVGLGLTRIILAGWDLGSVSAARYLAGGADRRVLGAALLDPIPDPPGLLRAASGDKYAIEVARSTTAVRLGRGDDVMVDLRIERIGRHPLLIQQLAMPWLAWWGPRAVTRLERVLATVDHPLLVLQVEESSVAAAIRAAAPAAPISEGVVSDPLAAGIRVASWMRGLGPPPPVQAGLEIVTAVSGDEELVGFLRTPVASGDTAVLLIHGISEPFSSAVTHVGRHLAVDGLASLLIELRRSGDERRSRASPDLELEDVEVFVRMLVQRGYRRVALAGASLGSQTVTRYFAGNPHPAAIAAIHLAATADANSPERLREVGGLESYQQVVERARAAVEAGRGDSELMLLDSVDGPPSRYPTRRRSWMRPAAFLRWRGPDAGLDHLSFLPRVKVPVLILTGEHDDYNDRARVAAVVDACSGSPRVDEIWYETDHVFSGVAHAVARDVAAWLEEIRSP